MINETQMYLKEKISEFRQIYGFIDEQFISDQCKHGIKNILLSRLLDDRHNETTLKHLPTLERRLEGLSPVSGYEKLKPLVQGPLDWDEYFEVLAQLDITLWFNRNKLLKRIEPDLSHRKGTADMLIHFNGYDICGEITSFQSIIKSFINNQMQDINSEKRIKRIVRVLLKKTKEQLPPNDPGILAINANKSGIFSHDVKLVAERLFSKRPQIAFIALWSAENDDENERINLDEPTYFYVNNTSNYLETGKELLQFLNMAEKQILII